MGASADTDQAQKAVVGRLGCSHYRRKLKFVTPCCDKIYTCRFCHDEIETHVVNRKEITEVICTICETRQPVRDECQKCATKFAKYTCLECNLFDDEDKSQFHCEGCGICRAGGAENYFHCATCKLCLPLRFQDNHVCVENDNCPVCFEDMRTSRIPSYKPDCGHLYHEECYDGLLYSGFCTCQICQVSLLKMDEAWAYIDHEIATFPMPVEYVNKMVDILCRDCRQNSSAPFHMLAVKCLECGSYNTKCINTSEGDFIPYSNNASEDLTESIRQCANVA